MNIILLKNGIDLAFGVNRQNKNLFLGSENKWADSHPPEANFSMLFLTDLWYSNHQIHPLFMPTVIFNGNCPSVNINRSLQQ